MLEKFQQNARAVVTESEEAARSFRHNYIGTEHILLALTMVQGIAQEVLIGFGVSAETVREAIVRVVGTGEKVVQGRIQLTPRAKRALERSLREVLSLQHSRVGTEHILLGLIRENEAVVTQILLDAGAEPEAVRDAVLTAIKDRPSEGYQESEERSEREWSELFGDGPACSQCGGIMEPAGGIFVCAQCGNNTNVALRREAQAFLAAWHQAVRDADEDRFFSMMAEDATFVGADDGEIWSKPAFRAASIEKFATAPAWSLHQTGFRFASADRNTMSFVELLQSEELGPCRGSGVLRMEDDEEWRVVLYVLSLSIPNHAIDAVKAVLNKPTTI